MGKKKKKSGSVNSIWCYYCEREFESEKILIQHQKAKHFKCHVCHKKLSTAGGMVIHVLQVHKVSINKVPNAKPERESIELEIFGMEGIPPELLAAHEGNVEKDDHEKPSKVAKMEAHPSTPFIIANVLGFAPQTQFTTTAAMRPVYVPNARAAPATMQRPPFIWRPGPAPPQGYRPSTAPTMPNIPTYNPISTALRPLFPIQGQQQLQPPSQPLFPIRPPLPPSTTTINSQAAQQQQQQHQQHQQQQQQQQQQKQQQQQQQPPLQQPQPLQPHVYILSAPAQQLVNTSSFEATPLPPALTESSIMSFPTTISSELKYTKEVTPPSMMPTTIGPQMSSLYEATNGGLQPLLPIPPPPPPPLGCHMYISGPNTMGPSIGPPPELTNKSSCSPVPPKGATRYPVYLIWDNNHMSMEEQRARLPRYQILDETFQMNSVNAAIDKRILAGRLSGCLAFKA